MKVIFLKVDMWLFILSNVKMYEHVALRVDTAKPTAVIWCLDSKRQIIAKFIIPMIASLFMLFNSIIINLK